MVLTRCRGGFPSQKHTFLDKTEVCVDRIEVCPKSVTVMWCRCFWHPSVLGDNGVRAMD